MDVKKIGAKLHPQESLLLKNIGSDTFSESELASLLNLSSGKITGTLGWLKTKNLIKEEGEVRKTLVSITEKGKELLKKGIPELRIIDILHQRKMNIGELSGLLDIRKEELNPVLGNMKKRGIISFVENGIVLENKEKGEYEKTEKLLRKVSSGRFEIEDLNEWERKAISDMSRKSIISSPTLLVPLTA